MVNNNRPKHIKNFDVLKHHCSVNYTISGEIHQIGKLSDYQLEVSNKILRNKANPTTIELQQLKAIDYVANYRSKCALEKIQNDIAISQNARLIKKAMYKADIIVEWIEKSYK
jgi:hypothetical protein